MAAAIVCVPKHSGALSSWCRNPGLGIPMWGSNHSLLGEKLCDCNYPLVCGSLPHRCIGLDYTTSLPLLPILFWFLFKIFRCRRSSLPIFLISSCSVNSCSVGVPLGGGELGVFLLCHLGCSLLCSFIYPVTCSASSLGSLVETSQANFIHAEPLSFASKGCSLLSSQ